MLYVHMTETAECDEEGKVRLVGGPDSTRGRVEMCKWGQWTSLCADASWNNVTAQAVCRELGYTGSSYKLQFHTPFLINSDYCGTL